MNSDRVSRGGCSGRGRVSKGFSLLELVVSTLLVALIMLLAIQLTQQVHLIFLSMQRAKQPGSVGIALVLLRNDVQRASSARVSVPSNELILRYPDGDSIRYSVSLEQLERRVHGPSGTAVPRVLAKGISRWSWRMLNARLVELHLEIDADGPIHVPPASSHAPWRGMKPKVGAYDLRLALRGTPGSRSW